MYVEPVKENMTMVAIWGREAGVEFVINNRAWHDYQLMSVSCLSLPFRQRRKFLCQAQNMNYYVKILVEVNKNTFLIGIRFGEFLIRKIVQNSERFLCPSLM